MRLPISDSVKNTRLFTWLFPVLLLVFPLTQAAAISPSYDPRDCTESFFQALLDENATTIRSLTTIDFLLIGPDGRILDGATFSESVAGGSLVVEAGNTSRISTRLYGEAGVVTGFWKARGTLQGYRFDNEVAFSALCVRQGGSWKIASLQLTPLP